jgi:polyisoprenoid-binding protein YceI
MTTTVWTTVVALSALGVIASPSPRTRAGSTPRHTAVGGPPDTLVVNPRASTIRWRATGLGGQGAREGTVAMAGGMFVIRHERLTSGTFTIDMRSLGGALRGPDYMDVARYPTATFSSTGATRVGPARWQVAGTLTMRGVAKPIVLDTDVRWEELGHMIATSSLVLDRRQWEIGNGAPRVAGAVVDDDVRLAITLDARRKQPAVATR